MSSGKLIESGGFFRSTSTRVPFRLRNAIRRHNEREPQITINALKKIIITTDKTVCLMFRITEKQTAPEEATVKALRTADLYSR